MTINAQNLANDITSRIESAGNASSQTAVSSQLPGRENGPADALRHILISAELTRVYGELNDLLNSNEHKVTEHLGR